MSTAVAVAAGITLGVVAGAVLAFFEFSHVEDIGADW